MARMAIGADEKKKLYVLGGLLAAIVVVVFVLYRPTGTDTETETPDTTPKKQAEAPATPADAPKADGGAAPAGGTGGTGASGGITAASLVSVSDFRGDPFAPVPLPPPLPTPAPPPPPPGPVILRQPIIAIEQPGGGGGFSGGGLPPFGVDSNRVFGAPRSEVLADMPPITIPRVASAPRAPTNFIPPGGTSAGGGMRSPNKRLSGVIIGDSVRALLVIETGDGQGETTSTVTRVVQPGDEVDGIRILRIERTTEGGRSVVRMYIRENGEERFVDLRPAPQQAGQGGAGGLPGGGRVPF